MSLGSDYDTFDVRHADDTPDVGEPFDVGGFAFLLPNDQNAK
jgi:hypothetical protein